MTRVYLEHKGGGIYAAAKPAHLYDPALYDIMCNEYQKPHLDSGRLKLVPDLSWWTAPPQFQLDTRRYTFAREKCATVEPRRIALQKTGSP